VAYKVKLKEFEGPLDLLLDLIEQEKLDVTTVSLATIADDYLQEVRKLEEVKVESLVDFLVVASQLLVIKSRALLPLAEQQHDEPESADELARRLAELKKFREAAELIAEELQSKRFSAAREPTIQSIFYPPPDLEPADLAAVFDEVIATLPSTELMEEEVVTEVVTLEDKLAIVQRNLRTVQRTSFGKLTDKAGKTEVIVTFLALLELLKQRLVSVDQDQLFGEITVKARKPGDEPGEPGATGAAQVG